MKTSLSVLDSRVSSSGGPKITGSLPDTRFKNNRFYMTMKDEAELRKIKKGKLSVPNGFLSKKRLKVNSNIIGLPKKLRALERSRKQAERGKRSFKIYKKSNPTSITNFVSNLTYFEPKNLTEAFAEPLSSLKETHGQGRFRGSRRTLSENFNKMRKRGGGRNQFTKNAFFQPDSYKPRTYEVRDDDLVVFLLLFVRFL